MMNLTNIHVHVEWPTVDRPREKLYTHTRHIIMYKELCRHGMVHSN